MTTTTAISFADAAPEFVAVVLASSTGARLFPLSSTQCPKHLLPLAGVPLILRLLQTIQMSGFVECVIAVTHDDNVTVPLLKEQELYQEVSSRPNLIVLESWPSSSASASTTSGGTTTPYPSIKLKITVLRLGEENAGSVEAWRRIEKASIIHPKSNIVIFPGDLLVMDVQPIERMIHAHRLGNRASLSSNVSTACTVLLSDVGEMDEHGVPLKESAKQKKGGLAREEEEIEYIALSYANSRMDTPGRIVWKQSKLDVEEDEDMIGQSPKLMIPKLRLRYGVTKIRTDWNDVHVYAFAPWVRQLILIRKSLVSIRGDLLPLLIARQFKGIVATFGSNNIDPTVLDDVFRSNPNLVVPSTYMPGRHHPHHADTNGHDSAAATTTSNNSSSSNGESPQEADGRVVATKDMTVMVPYAVQAIVDPMKSVLRAHSIASYLYGSREFVSRAIVDGQTQHPSSAATTTTTTLSFPMDTSVRAKFQTIVLPQSEVGDKVSFKSVVVGRHCRLGPRCRLNNVILMDHVTIGDNTILQNSVIGRGATIAENCSLNECQVGPDKLVPAGTKEKGETFAVDLDGYS